MRERTIAAGRRFWALLAVAACAGVLGCAADQGPDVQPSGAYVAAYEAIASELEGRPAVHPDLIRVTPRGGPAPGDRPEHYVGVLEPHVRDALSAAEAPMCTVAPSGPGCLDSLWMAISGLESEGGDVEIWATVVRMREGVWYESHYVNVELTRGDEGRWRASARVDHSEYHH